jgi:hypothetical protein
VRDPSPGADVDGMYCVERNDMYGLLRTLAIESALEVDVMTDHDGAGNCDITTTTKYRQIPSSSGAVTGRTRVQVDQNHLC